MLPTFFALLGDSLAFAAHDVNLLLAVLVAAFLLFVVLVMDRSKRIAAKDDWKSLAEEFE